MLKKLQKLSKKKQKIVIIIVLIFLCIIILATGGLITNSIRNAILRQAEKQEEFTYKTYKTNGNYGTALITFYNENGIESIRYKDKDNKDYMIYCNGKNKVAIDYEMEDRKTYEFVVNDVGNAEKNFILEYELPRVQGVYSKKNGLYVNEPDITGYVKEKTRYLYLNDASNLVPGGWIVDQPPETWYDYKEQKWANIYVESNGIESYYVWIPRYCYKIGENERTDVKFINVYNEYIDGATEEKLTWNDLQAQGYQLPEAFAWGEDDYQTIIPGYWMSKYQLSELSGYTVDFNTTATPTSITIQEIKSNTTKNIAKYIYAINGKVAHESTNGENYTITGLERENKAVNVTLLDENGEIIGSMTKIFEIAEVNPPDLTGFDKDTTFYVYWDENGIEHNEIPISMEAPKEWYDYGTRNWANIVTRNNGLETYLVWIPRYQYALDTVSQRSYVKFIKGTGTEVDVGYKIPEAFTWGDSGETQLPGYWMSKYQLSTESSPKLTAEMAAGGTTIQIKDITGTAVVDGLKYEYYVNGIKVHEGTDAKENYTYTGLAGDTVHTINIIARKNETNEYVAAITQKVETIKENIPELIGFNEDRTYYVLYDAQDNMTIGDKIKNDGSNMPENWYDYGTRKWANIVVTDGTIENGQIVGATSTTYLVWIPRYQYSLDTVNQRTNVKFVRGISTETEAGYKIPEAFTWGDSGEVQLTGYWMSKYQLSN